MAFDIETLGLLHEVPLPEITCVCMHDGEQDLSLRLWWPDDPNDGEAERAANAAERARNVQTVLDTLDAADRIVGYNAVLFDLEFLRRRLELDHARVGDWVLKCFDPYMCLHYGAGLGCKMQRLLELNGLASKTGSGANAIQLARTGQWASLLAYCLMDARLTYQLCALEWIRLSPTMECRLSWGSAPPEFRLSTQGQEQQQQRTKRAHEEEEDDGEALRRSRPLPPNPLLLASPMEWVCAEGDFC